MMSSRRVEATVVVPCLNGGRVLGACLAALDAQTIRDSLRVVVADGGSIDDSVARAREAAVDVVTTTDPGIWGPRNAGLAATTTPFYLGLDADCVASPAWAELLIEALRGAPADVIASGGRCEPYPTHDRWALREDATPHPAFGPDGPLYVNGGNACYRTDLLRRLGRIPCLRRRGRCARGEGSCGRPSLRLRDVRDRAAPQSRGMARVCAKRSEGRSLRGPVRHWAVACPGHPNASPDGRRSSEARDPR